MTRLLRSRFTYDRSVTRDVAATLNDVRGRCPDDVSWQQIVRALADTFAEHDPHFDADDFTDRCTIGRR